MKDLIGRYVRFLWKKGTFLKIFRRQLIRFLGTGKTPLGTRCVDGIISIHLLETSCLACMYEYRAWRYTPITVSIQTCGPIKKPFWEMSVATYLWNSIRENTGSVPLKHCAGFGLGETSETVRTKALGSPRQKRDYRLSWNIRVISWPQKQKKKLYIQRNSFSFKSFYFVS